MPIPSGKKNIAMPLKPDRADIAQQGRSYMAKLLDRYAAGASRDPSEAQKAAGNYRKGHVNFHGLDISIENPKGSHREGIDPGGKPWKVQLPAHYGYIKRTEGADGDHVDCYMGPDLASHTVFVVDQIDHRNGKFDEHKVMLGYSDQDKALSDYKKAFSDGKGEARIGAVTSMSIEKFKIWLDRGDTTVPLKPGKASIGANIKELKRPSKHAPSGRSPDQALAIALRIAGVPKRADGGHVGALRGDTEGSADDVMTSVPDGSHILSADCVAALGDGNSEAGFSKLERMFPASRTSGGRMGMKGGTKIGLPKMAGMPKMPGMPHMGRAHGGPVKVALSDGEFSVPPEQVVRVGRGDAERGHRALDAFQMKVRNDYVKKLRSMPGPVQS
jgi:hypothetical protein